MLGQIEKFTCVQIGECRTICVCFITQNECARYYKSGFSMPNMLIFVCTYSGVISYQLYTLFGSCVCMDIVGTGANTINTQVICGRPYVLTVYACIAIGSYRIIGTGQFGKTKFLNRTWSCLHWDFPCFSLLDMTMFLII